MLKSSLCTLSFIEFILVVFKSMPDINAKQKVSLLSKPPDRATVILLVFDFKTRNNFVHFSNHVSKICTPCSESICWVRISQFVCVVVIFFVRRFIFKTMSLSKRTISFVNVSLYASEHKVKGYI